MMSNNSVACLLEFVGGLRRIRIVGASWVVMRVAGSVLWFFFLVTAAASVR